MSDYFQETITATKYFDIHVSPSEMKLKK